MRKQAFASIRRKNDTIDNIIRLLDRRKHFVIVGHQNPDEDCIASTVAFGLLVSKFSKHAEVYLSARIHEHFNYLLSICRFNTIRVVHPPEQVSVPIDVVIACDTPKKSMLEIDPRIERAMEQKRTVVVEVDHHLGGDSEYIGQEGYRLVTEASSAAELVGQLVLKLRRRERLIAKYGMGDPLSRNLVLAILTGIIGDSKMGQFLKSRKEERYYRIFSSLFSEFLTEQTTKRSNISNMDEVFREIQKLSQKEESCHAFFRSRVRMRDSVGVAVLGQKDAATLYGEWGREVVVNVARSVADELAEESGKLSLIGYVDDPAVSNLIQFRMRRSKAFKELDLRTLLPLLSISDGGGHEGAIGFRLPRDEVPDLDALVRRIVRTAQKLMS